MKQTFTIDGFDHHLLINDNERTLLIDTGSPFSIFNGNDFEFLGMHVFKGLMPVSPDTISDLLGTHVDALVGNDMLQQFSVLVDYSHGTITFSDEDLSLPGSQSITLGRSFGVPKVTMQLRGKEGNFFLDTGAKISYVKASTFVGLTPDGQATDFYVGYGDFETPIYHVPTSIGGYDFNVQYGTLPGVLELSLIGLSGTTGVVGYDFFNNFTVLIDYKNGTLWLRPVADKTPEVPEPV